MNIINKIKGYFKKTPLEYIRRYSEGLKNKHECEKILGYKNRVQIFAKFYKENKEDLIYLNFVLQYKYKGTSANFIGFLQDCETEENMYTEEIRRRAEEEKTKEDKEKKRKTLHGK